MKRFLTAITLLLLTTALSAQEYAGAERMREIDPHGWTLSIIAVGVVFSALLVLFLLYSALGGIFTGRFKRKGQSGSAAPDEETAAAIAMALTCYGGWDDDAVAIAAALHLYLNDVVHDAEPGFITIRHELPSTWGDKSLILRKKVK